MPQPKNKCLGCTDRHTECHSECESYQLYHKECIRIRDARRKDDVYNSYLRYGLDKAERRNRMHGYI